LSRCPAVMPEDAGIGATPQSPAQAASDRMRLMLSPATMSSSAAVSGPMLLGVDRGAWLPGRPEGLPSDGGTSAGSGDLCGGLRWVTRTVDRDWILWIRSGRRGQAAAMAVLPDSLSDGKQTLLSKLTAACPEMTSLAALVCSFAGLLTPAPANEAALKDWAEAARACDLPNMHAFTRGLDLDIDAAIAAVTLPFHNGRTEGVNTKTKMIKRQIYGRAGFALLRHRILLG
jgi:hypothetical protein